MLYPQPNLHSWFPRFSPTERPKALQLSDHLPLGIEYALSGTPRVGREASVPLLVGCVVDPLEDA
jgi:hypothetical protein